MQLIVEGMTCGHCTRTITKSLHALDANAAIEVDLPAGIVKVDGLDADRARAAIEAEGYRVASVLDPR
jgi:copper chaperone